MKQAPFKSKSSLATYALPLCFFIIGFTLIGTLSLDAKGHEEFKIALLLPASITDGSWNAFAYEGLKAIEKELGAKISHVESRTPTDQEAHFRDYAMDGYQLIFGHGFEYQDPAKAVAPDFPETVFMTSTGSTVTDNISPMVFGIEEPVYLAGIVAGSMTQTDKIGILGGQNIPAINSAFVAFENGVESANPNAEVRRSYVGNWEDIGKGKELSLAQINEGVDFIFQIADTAGLGAYEAAEIFNESETAQKEGKMVYTFGMYQDQSDISPTTIIANAVVTPQAFVQVAKRVMEGTFKPKLHLFTMGPDEAITFVYNPKLKDKVPEAAQKAVAEAKAKIIAGDLKIPQTYLTEEDSD